MVKALARAFRWRRMLEEGRYASISEIATAEKIDRGYVGSILRLTLLAPDTIEAILNGIQPTRLGLPTLLKPFRAGRPSAISTSGQGCDFHGSPDRHERRAAQSPRKLTRQSRTESSAKTTAERS
jgi:hypothetical protein